MHWEETVVGCSWIEAVNGKPQSLQKVLLLFFFPRIWTNILYFKEFKKVPCTVNLISEDGKMWLHQLILLVVNVCSSAISNNSFSKLANWVLASSCATTKQVWKFIDVLLKCIDFLLVSRWMRLPLHSNRVVQKTNRS